MRKKGQYIYNGYTEIIYTYGLERDRQTGRGGKRKGEEKRKQRQKQAQG